MPKPIKTTTKAKAKPAPVELPAGVLAVIELKQPLTLGKMQVTHLNVRKKAGVREMAAVQLAYRRAGIILTGLQVLGAVANSEFLAMATLIDEMCDLPSGTAYAMGETETGCNEDYFTASLAIRPFVMMLP